MRVRTMRLAAFVAAGALLAGLSAGPSLAQAPQTPPAVSPAGPAQPAPGGGRRGQAAADKPAAAPAAAAHPKINPSEVLRWTNKKDEQAFREMEKYFDVHTIKKGVTTAPLPAGTPIDPKIKAAGKTLSLEAFIKAHHVSGLIAVKDGKVVLEKYGLGRKPDDKWTSFSVAKSVTSILFGAAIQDHYIIGLTDSVTTYLPEMTGTAYDGVNLEQILTMTSGVKWNETYTDKKSDVAQSGDQPWDGKGVDPLITYMAKLPREAKPGAKFVYKTGETDLAGLILARALGGKTLSQYASEKLWAPYGMEQDGIWMTDQAGFERGGCCMSMTLRDYARIGLFMLGGGKAAGKDTFPPGWIEAATKNELPADQKVGYGYFWWTADPPNYSARGIFGQAIAIYPNEHLVIAINSAQPKATDTKEREATNALFEAIRAAAK